MSVYYASKAYILSFSEALSNEVKGTGVSVTVLCPGLTKTGFQQKAAELSESNEGKIIPGAMKASEVAHSGYQGMLKGRRIVIPGLFN